MARIPAGSGKMKQGRKLSLPHFLYSDPGFRWFAQEMTVDSKGDVFVVFRNTAQGLATRNALDLVAAIGQPDGGR